MRRVLVVLCIAVVAVGVWYAVTHLPRPDAEGPSLTEQPNPSGQPPAPTAQPPQTTEPPGRPMLEAPTPLR